MKLILALGNAESRYAHTRHNTGFGALDAYAQSNDLSWQRKDKFKAEIAETTKDDERIILAKPTTYYNKAGESARAIMDFFKIAPADTLVIHDDVALPFGVIRTRNGGRDAGNNGLKSIAEHVGTDTMRIRIGIWNELRDQINDADFVLSKFTSGEQNDLEKLQPKITGLIDDFIADRFEATTHR